MTTKSFFFISVKLFFNTLFSLRHICFYLRFQYHKINNLLTGERNRLYLVFLFQEQRCRTES